MAKRAKTVDQATADEGTVNGATAKEVTVNDVTDIHKYFTDRDVKPGVDRWYRGQGNRDWPLLPKAGRPEFIDTDDLRRFDYWKHRAVSYMPHLPASDWECLALAQHHGLATRLLDWTYNPLVAVYFACCDRTIKSDGCVFIHGPWGKVNPSDPLHSAWFGAGFVPKAISSRMLGQQSVFTVQTPPDRAIDTVASQCKLLIIPAELKPQMLEHLNGYGINYVTLFPDLDGLSHHVNWETEEMAAQWRHGPKGRASE